MPHFLQAAVASEVAAPRRPSVERTGARRARARQDDSQSAVVRGGVNRPADPPRESQCKLRNLFLPRSERQDTGWGRVVAKEREQQG